MTGVLYHSLSILEIKVHDGKTKCLKSLNRYQSDGTWPAQQDDYNKSPL
jgi:hypothetical protein